MPIVVMHTSPLLWSRVLAMLFACVAFSVAIHGALVIEQPAGDWCVFCWGFSFCGTALVLLVELCGLQARAPVSWKNFPITFACYAALFCLSATIIFPLYFVKGTRGGESYEYRIVALVFSCLATICYLTEVSYSKARPGEVAGYMATVPGLLKVCETFVACIIFVFVSDPVSYDNPAAIKWCMAVYCICFILSAVVIVLCVGECTGCLPFPFARFLSAYASLAVLMYLSAIIIWPIYKFDRKHGGVPNRPYQCSSYRGLCPWDKLMAVAVLTGVNLVFYLVDLIYSARLVFVTV